MSTARWSRLVRRVLTLREEYPVWGKDKLAVLLREGEQWQRVATSMVGRILAHLKRSRQLIEPRRSAISAKKRRRSRTHAVRKPKDYEVKDPGDLVQVDTLDARPLPNVIRKQFTARDIISPWDVLDIRSTASAKLASELIDQLPESTTSASGSKSTTQPANTKRVSTSLLSAMFLSYVPQLCSSDMLPSGSSNKTSHPTRGCNERTDEYA